MNKMLLVSLLCIKTISYGMDGSQERLAIGFNSSSDSSSERKTPSPTPFRGLSSSPVPVTPLEEDSHYHSLERKFELLQTLPAEHIQIVGDDQTERSPFWKSDIIAFLASFDDALTIDDTDDLENPRLIIDLDQLLFYSLDVTYVEDNFSRLLETDPQDITLWKGTKLTHATEEQKRKTHAWIINTVKALQVRGESEESDGVIGVDLDKLPQTKVVPAQKTEKPSLLQKVVIPVAKGAGLVTLGYLLATYGGSK